METKKLIEQIAEVYKYKDALDDLREKICELKKLREGVRDAIEIIKTAKPTNTMLVKGITIEKKPRNVVFKWMETV